uniref:Uncharacterized protein n=1 Tax=Rhizophora mucronata TaxID=61149 RepID=A0A2P2QD38_RHIMU
MLLFLPLFPFFSSLSLPSSIIPLSIIEQTKHIQIK